MRAGREGRDGRVSPELVRLRAEIDDLDRRIVALINERNEPNEIPRAIGRAMTDYYGEAVRQLRALA